MTATTPEERELANPPAPDGDGGRASLQALLAERDAELERVQAAHATAIERLRTAFATSDPAIDLALITGDTVEALEASYAAARETVARVRTMVSRETAPAVPAGAPGRQVATPATAFEKIRAGLGRMP